jgi:succinate dehydrogenase / fumarate reductase membrane anchor subunit
MTSTATRSYLMQRVTGAIMIPTSIWILFCLLPQIGILTFHPHTSHPQALYEIFGRMDSLTYILIFAICSLYHGILGMQSVINDYIHCSIMKKLSTIAIYSFAIFSIVFLSMFSIDMHMKIISCNETNKSVVYD